MVPPNALGAEETLLPYALLGLQLLQAPVRLVNRELVDAPLVFLAVGDFDRLLEPGAAGL